MKILTLSLATLVATASFVTPALLPTAWSQTATPAVSSQTVTHAAVAAHYAALVFANYQDVHQATLALQSAIDAFLASPSATTQDAVKKAWLAAREPYGQTEAFRFYGGPIDSDSGPEGRMNAWPMDESFVDSVQGKTATGLINNAKFKITRKNLIAQNERSGEENIATGWHAIEFLLWGQDLSETGPGARSFEDFVDGKAPNADRRRLYLKTVTDLLVDDTASLVKAWTPGVKTNYRAKFEKGGKESVRKMLVGLGSLSRGELAGERLEVALNSQDQEDEHSCFSDNTHRDAVTNAKGIENVWLGSFQRLDGTMFSGPSLRDLTALTEPELAKKTTEQMAQSVTAAEAIQAPFDREILGAKDAPGRQRIQKTIDSLTQQSKDLVAVASAVGIKKLTLVEP